ncbi:DUF397 domain-containing protein [Streptomyces sp. NBC_00203]
MQTIHWQKSTYSGDSSNCVYMAAAPDGTIRLRESEEPNAVLTTTPGRMRELIRSLKTPRSLPVPTGSRS